MLEAARRLGADLDTVCGGRGICGRCQVVPGEGTFAKWAITVAPDALGAPASIETDYHGNRPLRRRAPARVRGARSAATSWSTSRRPARSTGRSCARTSTCRRSRSTRRSRCGTSRCRSSSSASRATISQPIGAIGRALRRAARPCRADGRRSACWRRCNRRSTAEQGAVTVAIDEADRLVADLARLRRRRLRRGRRHRVDHDRRPPVRPHDRRGARQRRSHEPADPVRRGSDEPGLVRDDEPGRRPPAHRGGARRARRAGRRAARAGAGQARDRVLEVVLVGNPIMHHIVLGIDPTPLGQAPFTLATNRAVVTSAAIARSASCRTPASTSGRASPATSAPTPPAAILAEGPHRSEHMQLLVDVGTNAEIVLGDRDRQFAASSPTGPAFEGAQISSGQRATAGAIEGVRIDPVDARAAAQGDRRRRVVGRPDVRRQGRRDRRHRHLRVGHHRRRRRDVPRRRDRSRTAWCRASWPSARRASSPTVARSRTCCGAIPTTPATRIAITQNDVRAIQLAKAALRAGIDLLVEHAGDPPRRPTSAWPGRSAPTSIRCTHGARARARLPARRRSRGRQRRRHRRRAGAALASSCGPRWSRPCATSSRSRPRPSRGSRSCSWRRWRSRMPRRRPPNLASARDACPSAVERSDRSDAGGRGRRRRRQETHDR